MDYVKKGITNATRARDAIAARMAEDIEAGTEPSMSDVEGLGIFNKKIDALKGLLREGE